jgi:hypothetical protein
VFWETTPIRRSKVVVAQNPTLQESRLKALALSTSALPIHLRSIWDRDMPQLSVVAESTRFVDKPFPTLATDLSIGNVKLEPLRSEQIEALTNFHIPIFINS